MGINPVEQEVIARYCAGDSLRQIASAMNISPSTVRQYLKKPQVELAIKERLEDLQFRILDFKLRAFDGAEASLEKLINLSQHAKTEELQRLASLDTVKIAGLMPRKRILLESSNVHGIDSDLKDWLRSVLQETRGVVDAPQAASDIIAVLNENNAP